MHPHHQLFGEFLDALITRDSATLLRVVAENAVWHLPPSTIPEFSGPHRGRPRILELVSGASALFVPGSQSVEILRIVAEGDWAAALFRQTARTINGRDYDNRYAFFFRAEAGQISEVWENLDTGYFYTLFPAFAPKM
jgi:ketosteroid isomerase-like protein